MGWLLGCFRCRQKHHGARPIDLSANCKEQKVAATAANLGSNFSEEQGKEVFCQQKYQHRFFDKSLLDFLPTRSRLGDSDLLTQVEACSFKHTELDKSFSTSVNKAQSCHLVRKYSSEQLQQVENCEEAIDSLNRKPMEEAKAATDLKSEVKHLQTRSSFLESQNAFREALNSIQKASTEGQVEESQPLSHLQSLLSKIEGSEAFTKTCFQRTEERRLSLRDTRRNPEAIEALTEALKHAATPSMSASTSHAVVTSKMVNEVWEFLPGVEQSACTSSDESSSSSTNLDSKQHSPLISVVRRRRSSTTLSFSGFFLMDDSTEEISNLTDPDSSGAKADEKCSHTLVDASRSLSAFAAENLKGCLSPTEKILSVDLKKDANKSSSIEPHRASSCEDESVPSQASLAAQHDIIDTSYDGFSYVLSCISADCSINMDETDDECSDPIQSDSTPFGSLQTHIASAQVKASANKRSPEFIKSEEEKDTVLSNKVPYGSLSNGQAEGLLSRNSEDSPEEWISKASQCKKESYMMELHTFPEVDISAESTPPLSGFYKTPASPGLDMHVQTPLPPRNEHMVELSSPETMVLLSPDPSMSPHTIDTSPPLLITKQRIAHSRSSSNITLPMSNPVDLQPLILPSPVSNTNMQQFTPIRTPSTSHTMAETPISSMHSQSSPASCKDRPILGTVAANWSHLSTTQKWWDGKGIPNSTNKYKEDQKVSWHATPFEVRLERALAKQGRGFQKKLFSGGMPTEMEVSM